MGAYTGAIEVARGSAQAKQPVAVRPDCGLVGPEWVWSRSSSQARYTVGCDWRPHRRTDAVLFHWPPGLGQGTCRWRSAVQAARGAEAKRYAFHQLVLGAARREGGKKVQYTVRPSSAWPGLAAVFSLAPLSSGRPPLSRASSPTSLFPLVVLPLRPLSRQRPAG